jgi:hypothetical protein
MTDPSIGKSLERRTHSVNSNLFPPLTLHSDPRGWAETERPATTRHGPSATAEQRLEQSLAFVREGPIERYRAYGRSLFIIDEAAAEARGRLEAQLKTVMVEHDSYTPDNRCQLAHCITLVDYITFVELVLHTHECFSILVSVRT